jgi:nucleoid-associated protein EbfC
MQQMAKKMQQQMEKIQNELGDTTVEGSAGGGAVTITMNGHREVKAIAILPEVVDAEDIEMLQDLLLAAINDASTRAQQLAEEKMGPLTSGLQLPGGLF